MQKISVGDVNKIKDKSLKGSQIIRKKEVEVDLLNHQKRIMIFNLRKLRKTNKS